MIIGEYAKAAPKQSKQLTVVIVTRSDDAYVCICGHAHIWTNAHMGIYIYTYADNSMVIHGCACASMRIYGHAQI